MRMFLKIIKAGQIAYISEYYSRQNFLGNAKQAAFVGRFQDGGDSYRSLLFFNLHVFRKSQDLINRGHPVYLRLNINRNEVPFGAVQAGIHRISSAWDPHTVTWDSQPGHARYPDVSFIIPAKWEGLFLLNINVLVNGWLNGFFPNLGLMIKGCEFKNSLVSFRGDVYPGARSAPVLMMYGN